RPVDDDLRELEIVGGKQCESAVVRDQSLGHGASQGQSVIGAGATADFVEQHQAVFRGVIENSCCFMHFQHESALAASQVVTGADAGENAVERADDGLVRGYEAADVCEQNDQGSLAHIGGFSAHVGA